MTFGVLQSTIASPAYPKPIRFIQPDGSTITLTLKGDEHTKWASTTDDYTLMSNPKGYYEYATTDSRGNIIPSGIKAKDKEQRQSEDIKLLSKTSKGLRYSKEQVQMLRTIQSIRQKEARRAFPTTGNRKLICILMGFKDKAFTKTQADFNNLFNQVNYSANGATGSVKDYYLENSFNKFNLTVTVAGPYTASQNMAYYGANDSNDNDVKPDVLVTEAVTAADAAVNYADFDNDNDGNVDGVYVIYAGYGEEAGASANAIWAHAWEIPSKTLDGKIISSYSCSAELESNSGSTMTSIGVICHEFGHVLGAPDYYDTNYDTGGQFDGTGDWDLMAGGSWNNNGITPAHHNAYTKVMVYGWANATTLEEGASITMPSSQSNSSAFYRINTTTANEYFLMENRQQTGFNVANPGHGLLIFHVSKDVEAHYSNNDINAKAPQNMYPVCASATSNPGSTAASYGSISSASCPFPGSSNKREYTDASMPSMKSWASANTGKPITNISENTTTGIITFDFNGGYLGNPTGFTATQMSTSQIDLAWTKSENRDVVVAFSLTPNFGSLIDGTTYSQGEAIVGGGTILVFGDASNFPHTGLVNNKTYYYKIWTKLSATPTYSPGVERQATTATGDPNGFTATPIATSQIDLAWTKSENKNVVIAVSPTPAFGTLNNGTTYSQGESIPGGGTIIVAGDATSFSHTGLNSNTTYYYKAWSTLSATPTYSPGTVENATTMCSGTIALPVFEDFEDATLPGCWTIDDHQGNGQIWQFGNIAEGLSGTYAYLNSDDFGGGNSQNADLVTPSITLNGANSITLSFRHYFRFYETGESAQLSYSIDNGTTWVELDKWTASTTNPANYKKIITAISGKPSVKFKWNYTGTYGYYWCVDDIRIAETTAADFIPDFNADLLTVNIGEATIFTNLSNGTITAYAWDFGDGASPATATTAGPHTVTYATAGMKTVALTVNGSVTETKSAYITVVDPNAPAVVVSWDFEDSNLLSDDGITQNSTKTITSNSSGTISYAGGSGGTGTIAISNTGWDNGNNTKAWQTEFSTLGYNNIKISSKQRSSTTGPKEFKLQYKTTGSTWIDVPSSNITVAANFTAGVLTELALPDETGNQSSVTVRWIMRSNLQVGSGDVASSGTSRIDDILVIGKKINANLQYTLTISKIGNGTVSPTEGAKSYDAGTVVSLTATPDQGWKFDKWEIDGTTISTASANVTMTANTAAKATFSLLNGVTEMDYQLKVFPNPFTSSITIESALTINNLIIVDLFGKTLIRDNNIGKSLHTMNLSELFPGSYMIRIEAMDNSFQTIKIIKR